MTTENGRNEHKTVDFSPNDPPKILDPKPLLEFMAQVDPDLPKRLLDLYRKASDEDCKRDGDAEYKVMNELLPGVVNQAYRIYHHLKIELQDFPRPPVDCVPPRKPTAQDELDWLLMLDWCRSAIESAAARQPGPSPGLAVSEPGESLGSRRANEFRRDGANWRVTFEGITGSFFDLNGMEHIATLLACPNPAKPIPALELVGTEPEALRRSTSQQPVLDPEAKKELAAELAKLNRDIDEARESKDEPRAERLEREKRPIAKELKRAIGLGDRDRLLGPRNPAEAARASVRQALVRAYKTLRGSEPSLAALADHLQNSIQTEGTGYAYRPRGIVPEWFLTQRNGS